MKKALSFIYHAAIMMALIYSTGYLFYSGNYVFGSIVATVSIWNFLVFIGVKKVKHFMDF